MDVDLDREMLRVVAHAVLSNVEKLVTEGLQSHAVATLLSHAMALMKRDAAAQAGARVHATGLWELLTVLHGPVSATLIAWLDTALGTRP